MSDICSTCRAYRNLAAAQRWEMLAEENVDVRRGMELVIDMIEAVAEVEDLRACCGRPGKVHCR